MPYYVITKIITLQESIKYLKYLNLSCVMLVKLWLSKNILREDILCYKIIIFCAIYLLLLIIEK